MPSANKMKLTFMLLIVAVGSGCGSQSVPSRSAEGSGPPDWYVQRTVVLQADEAVVGYGEGRGQNEREAETAAYNAAIGRIVRQLSPAVRVRIQNTSRQWDYSGQAGRSAAREAEITTESYIAVALDPEWLESECHVGRGGGRCYIALGYDPTPLPDRLARELRTVPGYCIEDSAGGRLVEASAGNRISEFEQRMLMRLGQGNCRIDWEIEYDRVGSYRMNALGKSWPLRLDDLFGFFPADDRQGDSQDELQMAVSGGGNLYEGAAYSIDIESTRLGHLHVFSVTESGLTQMLHQEQLAQPRSRVQWPGEKYEAVLDVPGGAGDSMRVLFGAALCEQRLPGGYLQIDQSVVDPKDPKYYTYGKLLRDMENRNCMTRHEITVVRGR